MRFRGVTGSGRPGCNCGHSDVSPSGCGGYAPRASPTVHARARENGRWEGEVAHLDTPYAPDADPTSSGSAGVGSARLCLEMSYTPRATKPIVTATCVRMIAMGNSPDSAAVMAVFSPGIVSMTPVVVRARRTRCARSGARSPTVAIKSPVWAAKRENRFSLV